VICLINQKTQYTNPFIHTHMAPAAKSTISNQWLDLLSALHQKYNEDTPRKLQLIDLFIVFSMILAFIQAIYAILSGSFPYNSYLAALFCVVGYAVLCICLRLQIANPRDFGNITAESAFAGFVVGNLALFVIVTTFMG